VWILLGVVALAVVIAATVATTLYVVDGGTPAAKGRTAVSVQPKSDFSSIQGQCDPNTDSTTIEDGGSTLILSDPGVDILDCVMVTLDAPAACASTSRSRGPSTADRATPGRAIAPRGHTTRTTA
jgi:hypothetical protein